MQEETVVRQEKLAAIKAGGQNPFPSDPQRTHMAHEVLATFDELEAASTSVTLAGRLRMIRAHGGITFAHLEDASDRIQIAFKRDTLGEEYTRVASQFDIGDFLEVTGTVFRTKVGERTVAASSFRLLAKALLPLPEKWHGLTDTETRYRQRYLDLIANPEVRAIFRARSAVVTAIRRFLDDAGFMEVETPILQTVASGAAARPFTTHHHALDIDLHLRIAPELYLKRLVIGGFEKVYEIARCFRNEGISFQHNPEFTQVEFYWAYANYNDLMDLTEKLVVHLVETVTGGKRTIERDGVMLNFDVAFPRLRFADIVKEKTGIDLTKADTEAKLRKELLAHSLSVDAKTVGYGELCDALYKQYVRPSIIQPTFVIDYPAAMIPLAKRKDEDPRFIASTQLLVQGMELTKAYNELNDPIDQEERFAEEQRKAGEGSVDAMNADAEFIDALKYGLPPTAGFGMGIDRLCSVLLATHSIKEVILFPTMRPLGGEETQS